MYKLIFTLPLLFAAPLYAEQIGSIHYTLPKEGGPWKIAIEDKQDHVHSVIYTHEGVERSESKHFFAVVATDKSASSSKEEDILAELKQNFPGYQVTVTILNRSQDQVTYSWAVKKDSFELSGMTKGINTHPGTLLFTYQSFGPLSQESLSYFESYFSELRKGL